MNPVDSATERSRANATTESRLVPRWTPACTCPAVITVDRHTIEGEVSDLSPEGAGLRFEPAANGDVLREGTSVAIAIRLGPATWDYDARIVWTRGGDGGVDALGLEYRRSAEDWDDPGPLLDLSTVTVDPSWALRLPAAIALRRRVIPLCEIDGRVLLGAAEVLDDKTLASIERYIDHPLAVQYAEPVALLAVIRRVYQEARASVETIDEDPVAACDHLLYSAWLRQASDIHLCPEEAGVVARLRVDGRLERYRVFPMSLHGELLSRIKVLAGMDIAERRQPQDGRFAYELPAGERVEIRAATLPTNHGERATLRLLAIQSEGLTLEHLGMSAGDLERCERSFRRHHGLILATGPTGCGKTTTLCAALRRVVDERPVNAIAVQEPVEYDIAGVTQVEVDSAQKVTFGTALRSILRHDPDVIMIGEIRDRETADIAIKAALTGHLVLATLHTNSAASAVTRIIDMGVERYLVAATLRTVIAQRLVRRLCRYCRRPVALRPEHGAFLGGEPGEHDRSYEPRGCVYCSGRGFDGRSGVFEILEMDADLQAAVTDGAGEAAIEAKARAKRARSMRDDALEKALSGVTAFDEVIGVLEIDR